MTARPGFTVTELMIGLALFSILLATTLGFYRKQGAAFTEGNDRMTVMQNLRYGVSSLDQHIRTAGVGVAPKQPVIVYAGERLFAFNANYASNMRNDFFAVYQDLRLPESLASAITHHRKFKLPGTSFVYPDSTYYEGAGTSHAETLIFFFAHDTSTPRTDDYVLYRQVNDGTPEILARHLLQTDRPFFTYYVLDEAGAGQAREAPASYIPAAHTVAIHGSPADTGAVAAADSIRAVRVSFAASNGGVGGKEIQREITRLIRLPNAERAVHRTCGSKPILGTSLAVVGVKPTESTPGHILLSWGQATDEASGEQDVLRYVIWRRTGTGAWGEPMVSIPPGASSYTYQDFSAAPATNYHYALAAQDCTPQYSTLSTAGSVQWNP